MEILKIVHSKFLFNAHHVAFNTPLSAAWVNMTPSVKLNLLHKIMQVHLGTAKIWNETD